MALPWMIGGLRRLLDRRAKRSYAQSGEDLIADFLFQAIGVTSPTYLDIGAHHPVYLNNTFRLYTHGCRGVCVDPDPTMAELFRRHRPRDAFLNVAVAPDAAGHADFYVMSEPMLSTLSRVEADETVRSGKAVIRYVVAVPAVTADALLKEHFPGGVDFLSIDIEGLDEAVLASVNWDVHRPLVVCAEAIDFATRRQRTDLINLMAAHGYSRVAYTHVNAIFLDGRDPRACTILSPGSDVGGPG